MTSLNDVPEERAASLFASRPRLLIGIVVSMFVLAAGVRMFRLDAPGVLIDRDFTSAMFARDFYLQHQPDAPAWRRDIAHKTVANQPQLEPPVTEWLVSLAYRAIGSEDLRAARLLTTSLWLLGGVLFWLLSRRCIGPDASVFSLGYYLFSPIAILVSRSVQAESLMMLLFVGSLLAIVRYHEAPGLSRLLTAAVVSAGTLIYRPLVMPALIAALLLPAIRSAGWRALTAPASWLFGAIATLPAFLYYGYAAFGVGTFRWKLQTSFMPHLYAHREFWDGWARLAVSELGAVSLALAFAGLLLLRSGLPRALVAGLGLGYICFGLAFTYHIHTHGYYHAQLIPAVALAASLPVALLVRGALSAKEVWLRIIPLAGAAAVVCVAWTIQVQERLNRGSVESAKLAASIGAEVRHSDRVVFVSRYYGLPLQYLGEFTGAPWPNASTNLPYEPAGRRRSVRDRLAALGFVPEYFVITHFPRYRSHHTDLRTYLARNCEEVARKPEYVIFGRCRAS